MTTIPHPSCSTFSCLINIKTEAHKSITSQGIQPIIFMTNMVIDLSASANILPTKIEQELPHIMLSLCIEDSDLYPNIVGMVDTGVTLTTSYMLCLLGICKNYPSLVHSSICLQAP